MVSDEDCRVIGHHAWHLNCDGYPVHYEMREGKQTAVFMHRLVGERMGIVGQIDHRDRNKLNCQRTNLRSANVQQNNRNVDGYGVSGFKGVYPGYGGRFTSSIRVNNRNKSLGTFKTAIDAAHAYDAAVKLYYGEYAVLNFPE